MFVGAIYPVAQELTQRISGQGVNRYPVAGGRGIPALGCRLPVVMHGEALRREFGFVMRALSSRGKTGLRRYVHYWRFGSVRITVQIVAITRAIAGVGTVQMTVHFDCALTVHFISDGFIP